MPVHLLICFHDNYESKQWIFLGYFVQEEVIKFWRKIRIIFLIQKNP